MHEPGKIEKTLCYDVLLKINKVFYSILLLTKLSTSLKHFLNVSHLALVLKRVGKKTLRMPIRGNRKFLIFSRFDSVAIKFEPPRASERVVRFDRLSYQ